MAPKRKAAFKPAATAAAKTAATRKPATKRAATKKPAAKPAAPANQGVRRSARIKAAAGTAADAEDGDEDDDAQAAPQKPAKKQTARKAPAEKAATKPAAQSDPDPDPGPEPEADVDGVAPLAQVKAKGKGKGKGKGKQVGRPGEEEASDDDNQLSVEPADEGELAVQSVATGAAGPANRKRKAVEANVEVSKKARAGGLPASIEDRMTSNASPHRGQVDRAREEARVDFAENSPITLNGNDWKLGIQLGAGSFGTAYVCYRTNVAHEIVERVAFKDMYHGRGHYMDWTHWDGDPRDFDNREHMEIRAMQVLTRAGADKCVKYLGHHNDQEKYHTRVFMDYCPHGSLRDLVYWKTITRKVRKNKVEVDLPIEQFIPEPVIWKFFEDLTEACLFMAYGSLEERQTATDSDYRKPYDKDDKRARWRKIVHRDFKPRNIFLREPDATEWPSYPTLCLGDYGLAIFTNSEDRHNPMEYNNYVGTEGYKPFELSPFSSKSTLKFVGATKLGDATNVWGMGISIMRTMNRQVETAELQPRYKSLDSLEPMFTLEAEAHYSNELLRLVRRCVRYKPQDRINLLELREQIQQYTQPFTDADLAHNMRSNRHQADDGNLRVNYEADTYRIGFALPPPQVEEG